MVKTPIFDHIAFTTPNLGELVDRLENAFGMVVESRSEHFALVADPASGLKLELGRSPDSEVHFRHLGFRTDELSGAHQALVDEGMAVNQPPHRRDFAGMHTSFLKEDDGFEIQLVQYD